MERIEPKVRYQVGAIRQFVRQWTAGAYTNPSKREMIATKSTRSRESKFIMEEVSPFCLIAEFMDFPDDYLVEFAGEREFPDFKLFDQDGNDEHQHEVVYPKLDNEHRDVITLYQGATFLELWGILKKEGQYGSKVIEAIQKKQRFLCTDFKPFFIVVLIDNSHITGDYFSKFAIAIEGELTEVKYNLLLLHLDDGGVYLIEKDK